MTATSSRYFVSEAGIHFIATRLHDNQKQTIPNSDLAQAVFCAKFAAVFLAAAVAGTFNPQEIFGALPQGEPKAVELPKRQPEPQETYEAQQIKDLQHELESLKLSLQHAKEAIDEKDVFIQALEDEVRSLTESKDLTEKELIKMLGQLKSKVEEAIAHKKADDQRIQWLESEVGILRNDKRRASCRLTSSPGKENRDANLKQVPKGS